MYINVWQLRQTKYSYHSATKCCKNSPRNFDFVKNDIRVGFLQAAKNTQATQFGMQISLFLACHDVTCLIISRMMVKEHCIRTSKIILFLYFFATDLPPNYRTDSRCGPNYLGPNGEEGICLANWIFPCCSTSGWCALSMVHCETESYRDFRSGNIMND